MGDNGHDEIVEGGDACLAGHVRYDRAVGDLSGADTVIDEHVAAQETGVHAASIDDDERVGSRAGYERRYNYEDQKEREPAGETPQVSTTQQSHPVREA